MKTLDRGFSPLSDDEMCHQAVANTLAAAIILPDGAGREATVAADRANLTVLLQHLADTLEIVPGVTGADLAATGFSLRKSNTHTFALPDAPQNVRVKATGITGELQILLGKVARAALYEVEYTFDPVNGPWTLAPAFASTRGITLTGLTRGKDYYARVRAVATGQNRGPWSDIANAMAM